MHVAVGKNFIIFLTQQWFYYVDRQCVKRLAWVKGNSRWGGGWHSGQESNMHICMQWCWRWC